MPTSRPGGQPQVHGPLTVELDALLQPGAALRIYFGPGDGRNRTVHVRAVVDGHFVIRTWSRTDRRWAYEVEPRHYFWVLLVDGCLSKAKR